MLRNVGFGTVTLLTRFYTVGTAPALQNKYDLVRHYGHIQLYV